MARNRNICTTEETRINVSFFSFGNLELHFVPPWDSLFGNYSYLYRWCDVVNKRPDHFAKKHSGVKEEANPVIILSCREMKLTESLIKIRILFPLVLLLLGNFSSSFEIRPKLFLVFYHTTSRLVPSEDLNFYRLSDWFWWNIVISQNRVLISFPPKCHSFTVIQKYIFLSINSALKYSTLSLALLK